MPRYCAPAGDYLLAAACRPAGRRRSVEHFPRRTCSRVRDDPPLAGLFACGRARQHSSGLRPLARLRRPAAEGVRGQGAGPGRTSSPPTRQPDKPLNPAVAATFAGKRRHRWARWRGEYGVLFEGRAGKADRCRPSRAKAPALTSRSGRAPAGAVWSEVRRRMSPLAKLQRSIPAAAADTRNRLVALAQAVDEWKATARRAPRRGRWSCNEPAQPDHAARLPSRQPEQPRRAVPRQFLEVLAAPTRKPFSKAAAGSNWRGPSPARTTR